MALEHFALRLQQQLVLRIVLREHVVQQAAGGLQLPARRRLPRKALEHQAGHTRELAKLAAAHFRGVDAGEDVLLDIVGDQQSSERADRQFHRTLAQQAEAVVVDRQAEGAR